MVTSGFFNSVDHDRAYDAVQLSSIFDGIINDGILSTYGKSFMVVPNNGMTVNVGSGRAWFNHTWTYNDSALGVTIEESELILNRIDAIVLDVNTDIEVRKNTIIVIKGTPATKPEKPELISDLNHHQYPLAYVTVNAGVTEITASLIENAIGTEACPFANGLMQQITTQELNAQWGSEFLDWWKDLRIIMSDDVAGNLQNEIDDLKIWVKGATITAGSKQYIVSNPKIKADSIIDVYYSSDSIYEATNKQPQYKQEEGKLTITFAGGALSKDIKIDGLHVINI